MTDSTDINIRDSAHRVAALLQQNRAREALELLEQQRANERLAIQEALDRFVLSDASDALSRLNTQEIADGLALVIQRLQQAERAPRYPSVDPRGTNELSGLTDAQRHDIYASIVQTQGSQAARDALSAGDRVILGLRQENSTLAATSRAQPARAAADALNTPRDESRGGTGVYDDRLVVLWRDRDGNGQLFEALYANTEPTAQYDHHAGSDGQRRFSDGGRERRRAASEGFEHIAVPRKIEGEDVDGDTFRDLGRLAEGSYEMRRTTHQWRGEESFALRPTDAAIQDGTGRVQRDTDADGYFTAADPSGRQPLNNSFKIHFGSLDNTDSAGCQTIHPAYATGFERAVLGNPEQTRWEYVLVGTTPGLWRNVQVGTHPPTDHPLDQEHEVRPEAPQRQQPELRRDQGQHHDEQAALPPTPRDPLFDAIRRQLPDGTSFEHAAHAYAQAREGGISELHQLDRVAVMDGQAWIVGRTPGFFAKVDLGEPAPPVQESLQRVEGIAQQELLRSAERQETALGPAMRMT